MKHMRSETRKTQNLGPYTHTTPTYRSGLGVSREIMWVERNTCAKEEAGELKISQPTAQHIWLHRIAHTRRSRKKRTSAFSKKTLGSRDSRLKFGRRKGERRGRKIRGASVNSRQISASFNFVEKRGKLTFMWLIVMIINLVGNQNKTK